MPDEITIKPKSESTPVTAPDHQATSLGRTQLVNLCALGLGVSFLLPQARFFDTQPSGFDLQKSGNINRRLWLILILSTITVFAGITKRSQKIVAQITGALPFCIGAYWYNKLGSDLAHILAFGAYLSLIFGAALFILPRTAK